MTKALGRRSPADTLALSCLMLAGMAMAVWPGIAAAQEKKDSMMTISGKDRYSWTESVKCDLGDIPDFSVKRLIDCDAAKFVELNYGDTALRAVRFQIDPQDAKISGGIRAELRDLYEAVNGEEVWYRLSTMLPPDFPVDADHRLVLAQWHERKMDSEQPLRPPLSHRLWNGRFVVTLWNQPIVDARDTIEGDGEIIYDDPDLERGVFHEFVYKIIWSDGNDGEIVAWKRTCPLERSECDASPWREVIRYNGATGYTNVYGYYFKFGLYTVTPFDVSFTAYHKQYRIGRTPVEIGATDAVFMTEQANGNGGARAAEKINTRLRP
ncbi:MAG: heparin lyase I family protein [Pseudomonadota bacterium]